jgi:virginiamycin B lyase
LAALGCAIAVTILAAPTGALATVISRLDTHGYDGSTITAGPDGAMWLLDGYAPDLVRVSNSGRVRAFPLPADVTGPFPDLTVGPDANLWFTYSRNGLADELVQMTPAGSRREYSVNGLVNGSYIGGLTVGPDRALWFTAYDGNGSHVGEVSPAGRPRWVVFLRGCCDPLVGPLVQGPDRNLWTVGYDNTGLLQRITPRGRVTSFRGANADPSSPIVAGPDGNLWFGGGGAIGRITIYGRYTEFPFPGTNAFDAVVALAAGPDGNVWFVKSVDRGGFTEDDAVGMIDRRGRISFYPLPLGSAPEAIAPSPDGRLWVTVSDTGSGRPGIFIVTPSSPGSGWPRPAQPQISLTSVSRHGLGINVACVGTTGLFCGGTIRALITQGSTRMHLVLPLTEAAFGNMSLTLDSPGLARLARSRSASISATFATTDFRGRQERALVARRLLVK